MAKENVNPNLRINLVRLRKKAGFRSALKFSEAVEIPHSTIRDIEAGYSNGQFETKQKIAKFFGITEADLLADPNKPDSVVQAPSQAPSAIDIAKAVVTQLEAAKPPPVSIQDGSAKAKLTRFVSNLSEKEAKHLYRHAQGIINTFRELETELAQKPKSKRKS